MERGDIFEFTAPNGVLVKAVCVSTVSAEEDRIVYLCYAQNRLFFYEHLYHFGFNEDTLEETCYETWEIGLTTIEYCIVPEFDEVLNNL